MRAVVKKEGVGAVRWRRGRVRGSHKAGRVGRRARREGKGKRGAQPGQRPLLVPQGWSRAQSREVLMGAIT